MSGILPAVTVAMSWLGASCVSIARIRRLFIIIRAPTLAASAAWLWSPISRIISKSAASVWILDGQRKFAYLTHFQARLPVLKRLSKLNKWPLCLSSGFPFWLLMNSRGILWNRKIVKLWNRKIVKREVIGTALTLEAGTTTVVVVNTCVSWQVAGLRVIMVTLGFCKQRRDLSTPIQWTVRLVGWTSLPERCSLRASTCQRLDQLRHNTCWMCYVNHCFINIFTPSFAERCDARSAHFPKHLLAPCSIIRHWARSCSLNH